jgi:hypothetical protein
LCLLSCCPSPRRHFQPAAFCLLSSIFCLPSPASACRQAVKLAKVFAAGTAIIKLTLHFPTSQIELPSRATTETTPIGVTLSGKRPAHFPVPATKQPGYPVCSAAPRLIALNKVWIVFDDRQFCLHLLSLSKMPKKCVHYANAQKDVG